MAVQSLRRDPFRYRIGWVCFWVVVLYVLLIGRLVALQIINRQYYWNQSVRERTELIKRAAVRGDILDRQGRLLATNTLTVNLTADPTLMQSSQSELQRISDVTGISDFKLEATLDQALDSWHGSHPLHFVELATKISTDAAHKIRQMNLPGIYVVNSYVRSYPLGPAAAQVVGMVDMSAGSNMEGKLGIEMAYNRLLSGQGGSYSAQVDPLGRIIPSTERIIKAQKGGDTVQTTLDSDVQTIAYQELMRACAKQHPKDACAIVMDPKTGDILALVNYPTFDPNNRATLKTIWALSDVAVSSLYEIGSTGKLITACAALQDGVITPKTQFFCDGKLKVGRWTIHDAADGTKIGHGVETIKQIIQNSCNVGAATIGLKLGWARLYAWINRFGMLDRINVGLPYEVRGSVFMGAADADHISPVKIADTSFGQSVAFTPLSVVAAYAAIANDGLRCSPRLISSLIAPNGHHINVPSFSPVRIVSPEVAQEVTQCLDAVVAGGTGVKAAVPGYMVAGKTGTSQEVIPGRPGYAPGRYVASFVGFLPANDPKAVIYVMLNDPKKGEYGGEVAAPVFRAIAQRLMWLWHIPPDVNQPEATLASQ
ncbi:MAG: penicillin-binding protein 2 [Armatimonadetes bacterium]|nr:penicillin-binding protein 2 [Armatimonadota bacterium]